MRLKIASGFERSFSNINRCVQELGLSLFTADRVGYLFTADKVEELQRNAAVGGVLHRLQVLETHSSDSRVRVFGLG